MAEPKAPETLTPTEKNPLVVPEAAKDPLNKENNEQLDAYKREKLAHPSNKSPKELADVQSLEFPQLPETNKLEIQKHVPESEPWQKLGSPKELWPCAKSPAMLYEFHKKHSAMDLVVADMNSGDWQIRPTIHPHLEPTSKDGDQDKASCVVNGGFFGGQGSMSYFKYGNEVFDPSDGLKNNPRTSNDAKAIISRSEIRVLKDKEGNLKLDIARHAVDGKPNPPPKGYEIYAALQAGPNLLDENGNYDQHALVNEGFIRQVIKHGHKKPFDAISSDSPDARTAVGITADGHILMLSVAGKDSKHPSRGVTIKELAGIMKELGCVKALNLDGGSSTTMYVRSSEGVCEAKIEPGQDVNSHKKERPVKSFLELVSVEPSKQP